MDDEIKKVFTDLVGFTKNKSPEVWGILIRQQYVCGVMAFIALVASIIGLMWGFDILKTRPEWAVVGTGYSDDNVCGWVITAVFGLCFVISMCVSFFDALPRLLNPKYYALMELKPRVRS